MNRQWLVYILLCQDNTLYTGITCDLSRRLAAHNSAQGGARYTRGRQPVTVVYTEAASSRSEAARREWRIKAMTTAQKKALVQAGAAVQAGLVQESGERC